MVTKHKKGTAITILAADIETEEFKRIPVFVRKTLKSDRSVEKIARAEAEKLGLNYIKADAEHVTIKYTMEDEDFYANAKEEIE